MQQQPQQVRAGSDSDPKYANIDERKRKRMISNRESAKRSRMKKQQRLEEMMSEVTQLKSENLQISERIESVTLVYIAIESENNVLRAQLLELTDTLRSLNSLLRIVEEVSGLVIDFPENLLEPWQLPWPIQPMPNAF